MYLHDWNPQTKKFDSTGQKLPSASLDFNPYDIDSNTGGLAAVDVEGNGYPWVFFKKNNGTNLTIYYYKNNAGVFSGPYDTGYVVVPDQKLMPLRFQRGVTSLYIGPQGCDMNSTNPCVGSVGVLTYNPASSSFMHSNAPYGGNLRFLDLNGDGLDDAVQWDDNNSGEWDVYMNEGGSVCSSTGRRRRTRRHRAIISLLWIGRAMDGPIWYGRVKTDIGTS